MQFSSWYVLAEPSGVCRLELLLKWINELPRSHSCCSFPFTIKEQDLGGIYSLLYIPHDNRKLSSVYLFQIIPLLCLWEILCGRRSLFHSSFSVFLIFCPGVCSKYAQTSTKLIVCSWVRWKEQNTFLSVLNSVPFHNELCFSVQSYCHCRLLNANVICSIRLNKYPVWFLSYRLGSIICLCSVFCKQLGTSLP